MIPIKVSDMEKEPESSMRMCWLPGRDLLDMGELGPVLDICGKEMLRLRNQESELLWTRMEAWRGQSLCLFPWGICPWTVFVSKHGEEWQVKMGYHQCSFSETSLSLILNFISLLLTMQSYDIHECRQGSEMVVRIWHWSVCNDILNRPKELSGDFLVWD